MAAERRPAGERLAALADRFGMGSRAFGAVLVLTAVGVVARLAALGARPMHYDEARVAYWGLRGAREGLWSYQPVVHGPLMQHFNRWLFPLLGSGDVAARLPVAVIGGLFPLAALLFRDRLRDWEVAALAGLLAVNPLLLYYSRFMRSDVLLAAFALVSLGALVRLYETRRVGFLYAAVGAFALAFASKENAFVYVLCWVGMFGLVALLEIVDPRRFESRDALFGFAERRATAAVDRLREGGVWTVALHGLGAALLFALVTVFVYAPRAPAGEGVGLWHSGPVVVTRHVVADVVCGLEFWSPIEDIPVLDLLVPESRAGETCHGFADEGGPLANFGRDFGRQLQVLGKTASAVVVLSLVGVIAEFRERTPRVLVPAAFYWGAASLLGYPVGADILYPAWVAVHVVVPLTIPAAVGVVALGSWAVEEVTAGDGPTAAAIAVAVLLLVGSIAGVAVHHAYVAPTGTYWDSGEAQMVQFAQPEQETTDALVATHRASEHTDGLDVLVYEATTDDLVDMGGSNTHAVPCMKFLSSLPLSWYLYSFEAEVTCADDESRLADGLASDPPVVITAGSDAGTVRDRLDESYVSATYELRRGSREVTFFFDASRVDPPARATEDAQPRMAGARADGPAADARVGRVSNA